MISLQMKIGKRMRRKRSRAKNVMNGAGRQAAVPFRKGGQDGTGKYTADRGQGA